MRRTPAERRRALRAGHGAERLAILYLRCKGYRILARRYRVKGGEIDVIARRGDTIAFVEVKFRPSITVAQNAIGTQKRRRITRAARVYLAGNAAALRCTIRADALCLAPWCWPLHVPAAFELALD